MYDPGTYWKRRKVEPYQNRGMEYKELHMRLPVGTFVRIEKVGPIHKDSVQYTLVVPCPYDSWDVLYKKIFSIFFEPVTEEEELGLVALADLD